MRPETIKTCLRLLVLGLLLYVPVHAAETDVVVIVSAKNPVQRLTAQQIADIFLGRNARFPDGSTATPIDMPENSRARAAFYSEVAGKSVAQIKMHWAKLIFTGRGHPPSVAANADEMKILIASNPDAIGYIPRSEVDDSVAVVEYEDDGK